ncbi:hypothetical protein D3C73_730380 [compost metagenome]
MPNCPMAAARTGSTGCSAWNNSPMGEKDWNSPSTVGASALKASNTGLSALASCSMKPGKPEEVTSPSAAFQAAPKARKPPPTSLAASRMLNRNPTKPESSSTLNASRRFVVKSPLAKTSIRPEAALPVHSNALPRPPETRLIAPVMPGFILSRAPIRPELIVA